MTLHYIITFIWIIGLGVVCPNGLVLSSNFSWDAHFSFRLRGFTGKEVALHVCTFCTVTFCVTISNVLSWYLLHATIVVFLWYTLPGVLFYCEPPQVLWSGVLSDTAGTMNFWYLMQLFLRIYRRTNLRSMQLREEEFPHHIFATSKNQ